MCRGEVENVKLDLGDKKSNDIGAIIMKNAYAGNWTVSISC